MARPPVFTLASERKFNAVRKKHICLLESIPPSSEVLFTLLGLVDKRNKVTEIALQLPAIARKLSKTVAAVRQALTNLDARDLIRRDEDFVIINPHKLRKKTTSLKLAETAWGNTPVWGTGRVRKRLNKHGVPVHMSFPVTPPKRPSLLQIMFPDITTPKKSRAKKARVSKIDGYYD